VLGPDGPFLAGAVVFAAGAVIIATRQVTSTPGPRLAVPLN
jgi:hypothetical protein